MIRKLVASLFMSALLATSALAQSVKTSPVWQAQGKLASAVSVTTASAPTLLPTQGFVAWVCNTGSNDAYIALGTSNAVTATVAGSSWLKAGTCAAYDLNPQIGTNYSYLAAITGSSTTSLNVETGAGAPPVQGGSSGGGGGSVTQGTTPWVDSISTWASGALGAMANYGTSPGAVLVPGVNAFVTNSPASPLPLSTVGVAPYVSAALEACHAMKASQATAISYGVTTGATAGFLMVFNATSAPADGAVTPAALAIQVPANATVTRTYSPPSTLQLSTGFTVCFSSTGPYIKTASATAMLEGTWQ